MRTMNLPENLTIEDLDFRRVGHSAPSGHHYWHGRMIQDHAFIEEYETKFGRFSPTAWNELALRVVKENGQYELYLAIKEYCRNNCAWLHKEEEYSERALSSMTRHSYKAWEDFNYNDVL